MAADEAPLFRREELLGGLPARRASTLLFAIERRTAALVRRSRQAIAAYESPSTEEQRDRAFLEAIAAGREERQRPTIMQLERHAPRWADLVPADATLRAALARLLGQAYALTYGETPRLRAALGLDGPDVAAAYERLHAQPLASIWRSAPSLRQRAAWLGAWVSERLESLPPFWMAFMLTFTEAVGAGVLALPVALAGLGVGGALVLVVVFGLVNLLTAAAVSEAVVRNGSMRYGSAYFGRLVSDLLGGPASVALGVALMGLSLVSLFALYIGFASVLEGATGGPAWIWILAIVAVDILVVRRGRLDATVASAMVIGAVNVVLILLIAALSLPFIDPANLTAVAPTADAGAVGASVVGLAFGVLLAGYFAHTSAAKAAKLVLDADPSGRSLIRGNIAAFVAVIALYVLIVAVIIGTVGPEALIGYPGTALTPLAEVVGPSVGVLGAVFAVLAIGMGTVHFSLGLYNQVMERLPARDASGRFGGSDLRSRLAVDDRLRLLAGTSPTLVVLVVVLVLTSLGVASFADTISIVGALAVPLLSGVYPMLLLLAARRRGEMVPGTSLGLAAHPIVVFGVALLFIVAVLLHALIWDAPVARAVALVVGLGMALVVVRIVRAGAVRPRTVIEVRREDRAADAQRVRVVSAGDVLAVDATGGSGAVTMAIPAGAARELLVWAHRVTPEGASIGLDGRTEVEPGYRRRRSESIDDAARGGSRVHDPAAGWGVGHRDHRGGRTRGTGTGDDRGRRSTRGARRPERRPMTTPRRPLRVLGDRSIATRLSLGLAMLVALGLVVVGIGYLASSQATRSIDRIAEERAPTALAAAAAESALLRMVGEVRGYLAIGDPAFRDAYEAARARFEGELERLGEMARRGGTDAAPLAGTVAAIRGAYGELTPLVPELFAMRDDQLRREPALRMLLEEAMPRIETILTSLDGVLDSLRAEPPGEVNQRLLATLADFQSSFLAMESGLRGYVTAHRDTFKSEYEASRTVNDAAWAALIEDRFALDASMQAQINVVGAARTAFLEKAPEMFAIVEGVHVREDLYAFSTEALPIAAWMLERIDATRGIETALLRAELLEGSARLSEAQTQALLAGLAAVLLGILVALVLRRSIVRPIRRLSTTADAIAQGDLEARAEVTGRDEVSALATSFNTMTEQVADTVTTLRQQNAYRVALHETTLGMMDRLDVHELLTALVDRAGTLLGAPYAFAYLVTPDHDDLRGHDRHAILRRGRPSTHGGRRGPRRCGLDQR